MQGQTLEEQRKYFDTLDEKVRMADLEAVMAIIKAKDLGQIKKRNILKLDQKINEKLRNFLSNEGAKYSPCLPETAALKYTGRRLPVPEALSESTGHLLTNDWLHWKTLPTELKEEDVKRMHSFLLLKPEDI